MRFETRTIDINEIPGKLVSAWLAGRSLTPAGLTFPRVIVPFEMSLAEVLPLAIDLPGEDRVELMREIATSMGLEVFDLEVEQRRLEMECDSEAFSLSPDQRKAELQKLRNGQ